MIFVENCANAVSVDMRSTISWNTVVPLDNTTWRTKFCGCPRRISERSVVVSAGLFTGEILAGITLSRNRKRLERQ